MHRGENNNFPSFLCDMVGVIIIIVVLCCMIPIISDFTTDFV